MDSLNSVLKQQAIELGLCEQWTREWDHSFDDREFCSRFKKGQDFCIKHEFPSLELIRQNFDKGTISQFGVFVDEIPSLSEGGLPNGTYVCLGECEGVLKFGRWSAALVYLRHDSQVTILADEFSRITVRLYDNASVIADCSETAQLKIFDRR